MPNKFKINIDVIYGKDSFKTLDLNLKNLNFKNPYLICDKIFENNEYINKNILFFKKKRF